MGYREEAIECVKDHVLPLHKQIYAKYGGDMILDAFYSLFPITHIIRSSISYCIVINSQPCLA